MASLESWIKNNNFDKSSTEVSQATHLLLNGGTYFIPKNKEYNFLTLYANELENGNPMYCVEVRPKIFKFMLDLDISDDHYWSDNEIIILTKHIQNIIRDFFDDDHYVICCASDKKIKNDKIHTGIHLIWNDLFVISETALIIRTGLIQKLKESTISISKPWEDIIDELVYTRVGYRMIGSDKMSKGVPENRPLKLKFVMDSKGEISKIYYERLMSDVKSLVLETSIRNVLDSCKDTGMIIKYPRWINREDIKLEQTNNSYNFSSASHEEYRILEDFICKKIKEYRDMKIKSIKRIAPDEKYKHGRFYIETNSRYCLNIGREHNSCGIYFFATEIGLWQKCYCACNKLECRKKGLCKDFISECFKFDDTTSKLLFPDYISNYNLAKSYILDDNKNGNILNIKTCTKLLNEVKEKPEKLVKSKKNNNKVPLTKEEFFKKCGI